MKTQFVILLVLLFTPLLTFAQSQVGQNIPGQNVSDKFGTSVSISADGNRVAIGAPENDDNGTNSGHTIVFQWVNDQWTQLGQNLIGEDEGDLSGSAVSISADGNRLAIGARNNGTAGHVRIYEWSNNQWIQLGQDIDGENEDDRSGNSIAISADGNRVAIGAMLNDGNGSNSGHTRIYEWNNNQWTQLGQDIDGENPADQSATSLAISADGNRVAIGARWNGDNASFAGHARIFEWNNNQWTQLGQDIDGTHLSDWFGSAIAISSDGNRVAIGGLFNDGEGENFPNAGHARIFEWKNNEWIQIGSNINGENIGENLATSIAISADGNRVALGSPSSNLYVGHASLFDLTKPNLISNDLCFTLDHNPDQTQYILEGDFTNCNIFVLDQNENVVQFLLNINDKITINLDDLPAGQHFIRVEHQQHDELFIQEIIKL